MSKTTVVINDELLQKAMQVTKAKTKKAVIEQGLEALIRNKGVELLREELGTYNICLSPQELESRRAGE